MLEEDFKVVFSKFFPFPGLAPSISSGSSLYAHYVFSCVDVNGMGIVNFEVVFEFIKKIPERPNCFSKEFCCTLALLKHGTLPEKTAWIFRLYDVNR